MQTWYSGQYYYQNNSIVLDASSYNTKAFRSDLKIVLLFPPSDDYQSSHELLFQTYHRRLQNYICSKVRRIADININ